jgi:hypothetical protein
LILRICGALVAVAGVLLFLAAGAGEWSNIGRGLGVLLVLGALPAFLAAEGATSLSRSAQIAALVISLVYLLPAVYVFLSGLAYVVTTPSGDAAFWLLLPAGTITIALLAATILLTAIVVSGHD